MTKIFASLAAALGLTLAACGSEPAQDTKPTAPAARSAKTQNAAPAPQPSVNKKDAVKTAQPPAPPVKKVSASEETIDEAAMLKRGRIVFLRCRSCHNLTDKPRHLTGPNLNGLMGAKAAAKDNYAYSDALASSGIVWTAETLDPWIESPSKYIPGTRMVFAGLSKASDRAALIAYLAKETQE